MRALLGPLACVALGLLAGCGARGATVRTARAETGETIPMIEVSPGVAGRLALMDAYRQHDEDRKHMMRRPRVTVEELTPEEVAEEEAASEAAPAKDAAEEPEPDAAAGVSATTPRPGRTSR